MKETDSWNDRSRFLLISASLVMEEKGKGMGKA